MRYRPLPLGDYMVVHAPHTASAVPLFSPYLTAPEHPAVWDILAHKLQTS